MQLSKKKWNYTKGLIVIPWHVHVGIAAERLLRFSRFLLTNLMDFADRWVHTTSVRISSFSEFTKVAGAMICVTAELS